MTLPNHQTAFLTLLIPLLISCGGGGGGSALEIPAVTPSFNVPAASGDNGSISPSMVSVVQGQTATFTVTPETGYSVLSASGCNGTLSENTYTTGTILAACSVTVQYAQYMSTVFEAVAYEFPYASNTLDNLCIENPTSVGAATSILLPVDLNLDTFNDLVVSYFCSPKTSGQYLDTPTPDAIIAFKNNGDQTFSIANSEVFGSQTIQLGGATRKGVLADFNGDKYLDILYALNREVRAVRIVVHRMKRPKKLFYLMAMVLMQLLS